MLVLLLLDSVYQLTLYKNFILNFENKKILKAKKKRGFSGN